MFQRTKNEWRWQRGGGGWEEGGPARDPATHLLGQGAGEARQEAGPGHFH